ncbi:hypothetical protein VVS222_00673 [Vibrio vulnificus]|nr:hypothetical protein VVS222_00673 [Vibrio vulnificus]
MSIVGAVVSTIAVSSAVAGLPATSMVLAVARISPSVRDERSRSLSDHAPETTTVVNTNFAPEASVTTTCTAWPSSTWLTTPESVTALSSVGFSASSSPLSMTMVIADCVSFTMVSLAVVTLPATSMVCVLSVNSPSTSDERSASIVHVLPATSVENVKVFPRASITSISMR